MLYLNKNMIDDASHDKTGRYDPNFSIKLYMTKQDTDSYKRKGMTGVPLKCAMAGKKKKTDVYNLMDLCQKTQLNGGIMDSDDEEK